MKQKFSDRDFYLLESRGVIYAWQDGRSVPLMKIVPNGPRDETWVRAFRQLLNALDLVSPETFEAFKEQDNP